MSLEGGREGREGRGGEGREGGREGRDDCYTYYSDGVVDAATIFCVLFRDHIRLR